MVVTAPSNLHDRVCGHVDRDQSLCQTPWGGRALVAGNGSRVLVPRDRTPEGVRGGVEGRVAWGGADRHQKSPFHIEGSTGGVTRDGTGAERAPCSVRGRVYVLPVLFLPRRSRRDSRGIERLAVHCRMSSSIYRKLLIRRRHMSYRLPDLTDLLCLLPSLPSMLVFCPACWSPQPSLRPLHAAMARGPKRHLKRLNAPKHWMLDKLGGVWYPRPSTGPHKLRECLPLIILLRNRLKYALNTKEVKYILMQRLVKVDGKPRTDKTYPAGFMGALSLSLVRLQAEYKLDRGVDGL